MRKPVRRSKPKSKRAKATPPARRGKLIFLTWSGERSKNIALALRKHLKLICNAFDPWMSDVDIATGERWEEEISAKLDAAQAAILCLTPENQDERWVHFEAGAIAKSRTRSLVIPYLYDMKAARDLKPPLSIFQAVTSALDEGRNRQMVHSLHRALPAEERQLSEANLNEAFDLVWPKLRDALKEVGPGPVDPPERPDDSAVLDEILSLVRGLVAKARRQESAQAYLNALLGEKQTGADQARALRTATAVRGGTGLRSGTALRSGGTLKDILEYGQRKTFGDAELFGDPQLYGDAQLYEGDLPDVLSPPPKRPKDGE